MMKMTLIAVMKLTKVLMAKMVMVSDSGGKDLMVVLATVVMMMVLMVIG